MPESHCYAKTTARFTIPKAISGFQYDKLPPYSTTLPKKFLPHIFPGTCWFFRMIPIISKPKLPNQFCPFLDLNVDFTPTALALVTILTNKSRLTCSMQVNCDADALSNIMSRETSSRSSKSMSNSQRPGISLILLFKSWQNCDWSSQCPYRLTCKNSTLLGNLT